ncbi:MAG: site-specific integrase [Eubacteriales bacterium]|nr:site-specific integrase [Eubacteriales bacterium]
MNIAGYLREKKGLYYAVIVYYTEDGKRKDKWFSTKLPIRGNKKRAEAMLKEIERSFVIPPRDLYVNALTVPAGLTPRPKSQPLPTEFLKKATLDDLTTEQVERMLFADYLVKYLPLTRKRKKKIEDTTYSGYCSSVASPIEPYFREKGITLGELEAEDIQDFYDVQLERVKPTTVIHYHAIIRLSLCHARKKGYIKVNPIDEVDKPEKNHFVGKFYDTTEVNNLFQATKDTKLELPALFGGFYGLRRSEIVGLRWSAFDFENDIFYVNHIVTTPRIDGKEIIVAKDRAKTKSSLRALPLDPDIKARLLQLKERQEGYRKKFKRSYSKGWLDYVMVDELGGLVLPNYITTAFKRFLEKNGFRLIRFHDLRHTCASLLLNKGKENGVTMKDIQSWLGHSDFATTANTYSHLDASSKTMSLTTLSGVANF